MAKPPEISLCPYCAIPLNVGRTRLGVQCALLAVHPQDMVSSVSSLLKIVRNVEDEAGRGVKTLENAIDTIKEELKVSCVCVLYLHLRVLRLVGIACW